MKGLIIGLGSIAQKHLQALEQVEEKIDLYALRSSTTSVPYPKVTNVYSYEEAEQIAPDFVIISNPTALHQATIERVAKWRKPLFIEKPVVSDLANVPALQTTLEDLGVLTYVACNLRFLDSLIFIKDYLSNKRINEVNLYCGSFLPEWRPGTDFRKSYSARPELGGGAHLDLIHEIDYAYWLFGSPQKTISLLRSQSTLAIPAIDYAHYSMIYDGFVSNITLNYFRREYKRTAEFLLEQETILIDLKENQVKRATGEILYHSTQGLVDTYLPQIQYFLQLVKTEQKTSMNTFQDGVTVLKMCLDDKSA